MIKLKPRKNKDLEDPYCESIEYYFMTFGNVFPEPTQQSRPFLTYHTELFLSIARDYFKTTFNCRNGLQSDSTLNVDIQEMIQNLVKHLVRWANLAYKNETVQCPALHCTLEGNLGLPLSSPFVLPHVETDVAMLVQAIIDAQPTRVSRKMGNIKRIRRKLLLDNRRLPKQKRQKRFKTLKQRKSRRDDQALGPTVCSPLINIHPKDPTNPIWSPGLTVEDRTLLQIIQKILTQHKSRPEDCSFSNMTVGLTKMIDNSLPLHP